VATSQGRREEKQLLGHCLIIVKESKVAGRSRRWR
jgi:hypothetical protein